MYEAFFGLKEKPFSMLPDPGFLFLSKKHQAALTLLEYGLLNHVGFCVISGEAGAGKTTILRALLERIDDDVTVGLITNTHQSFGGLLDWVLSSFDLHQPDLTQVEMHQIFMEFLIAEYAKNRTVLLIVDEAQNMQPDTLEELRMLSNVNSEKDQLMQVVLAGQPALKATLRTPELMQFAQRIAVDYHLEALNLKETCGYIQHRLITAGAEKDIFTPAACERIFCYSGGTPRLINLLCETVMVYGFADQQEMIDVDLVDEMVLERMKDSVVPIVNRDAAEHDNTEASKELEKDFPWIVVDKKEKDLKPETASTETASTGTSSDIESHKTSMDKQKIPEVVDIIESTTDEGSQTGLNADSKKEKSVSVNENSGGEKSIDVEQAATEAGAKQKEINNNDNSEKADSSAEKLLSATVNKIEVQSAPPLKKAISFSRSPTQENSLNSKKPFIKYAAIALVIGIILVAAAVMFNSGETPAPQQMLTDDSELQKQREQEKEHIKQLQLEAETLKKERDAAIVKAEQEKREKEKAEKMARDKAVMANKAAEKKRIAAARKKEQRAKQAEKAARAEASRAKREAAKFAEEKRLLELRLEEERRLVKQAETRRLELEWQQQQRMELQAAERRAAELAAAEQAAAEQAATLARQKEKSKNNRADCSGPTARFKSGCR